VRRNKPVSLFVCLFVWGQAWHHNNRNCRFHGGGGGGGVNGVDALLYSSTMCAAQMYCKVQHLVWLSAGVYNVAVCCVQQAVLVGAASRKSLAAHWLRLGCCSCRSVAALAACITELRVVFLNSLPA
jgi:hypothetical protein